MTAPRQPTTNVVRPSRLNGQQPPHDLDAEAAVLSAVLLSPQALAETSTGLSPDHFYADANRRIFEAVVSLHSNGKPVDVVTVATWLKDRERLGQVGGTPYLARLTDAIPVIANAASHAETVREKWRARQLIDTFRVLEVEAHATTDLDALLHETRTRLDHLARSSSSVGLLDGADLAAPLPPVDYLCRQLGLVAGGGAPHLVAGYGFSAKSVSAQALALSLASGTPIWGAYGVDVLRRVVHVDLEQGERLTRRRYQRLARATGVDPAALRDALTVLVMPGWDLSPPFAERWRDVMRGRDLLLLDSLKAATPGVDENGSEIRTGLDMLGALSEATGCRALVLHHARKTGPDDPGGRNSIRGSSAIFDAADSAYLFSAEKGEPVRVEHCKARTHGEPIEDLALVVSDVEDAGDPHAGLRVQVFGAELVTERREQRGEAAKAARTGRDAEAVRRILSTRPGLGVRELRAAAGLSGDRLSAALVQLGDAVDARTQSEGRTRSTRHFLREVSK